jgi:molecular chaperone GrpE
MGKQEVDLDSTTETIESSEEIVESEGPTLESVTAERDQLVDQLQRSVAEFQNYRRRIDQERFRLRESATQDVIRSILPVVDDLQRAIAVMPADQRTSGLGEGIAAIERKLLAVLERNSVTPVGVVGEAFDPAFHEAVATDESGQQTNVVEIFQTGYRQGDVVLRPAMVKVGELTQFDA